MSAPAPQKPWETGCSNQGNARPNLVSAMSSGRNILNSNAPNVPSQPVGSVKTAMLPPLPPRPPHLSMTAPNRPMYSMTNNMYGGYPGYSGYGNYSSYGSYPGSMYLSGGYGGYGTYGHPHNAFENRFLQVAEDSTRDAFQSIESLVRAFSSVSMMLESTYHAMFSSFRAILGVVDNFSRLRQMFAQFLSAITVFKMIQSFYRRVLYWLGILDHNPQSERIWEAVTNGSTNSQSSKYSSWALITFIGLLFGGPYLIAKFFVSNILEPKKWDPKKGTFYRASYPHDASSEAELSFSENELLNVAPPEHQLQDSSGWILAANRHGKVGFVPTTRLSTRPVNFCQANISSKSTSNIDSSVENKDRADT